MDKITIIGLGLIGGSIGMAIKQALPGKVKVAGYDKELEVGRKAIKRGAVDEAPWKLYDAVKDARMVIIATPVLAIRESMQTIAEMVGPGCVVTDTGSTKAAVMQWAEECLPKEVSFVGGHPMAGKELSGIDAADSKLFQGARYVVIPGKSATKEAVKSVLDLVELLGARPYFVDAQEHDSYVAAVSHLPILLSTALVTATTTSPSWREMAKLAATGYRDITRLASGDPVMNLDICVTNRDTIVHWIDQAIQELRRQRDMVAATATEEGLEKMGDAFAKAWGAREKWLMQFESGAEDIGEERGSTGVDVPTFGTQMADMLVGSRLRERYQQVLGSENKRSSKERSRRRK